MLTNGKVIVLIRLAKHKLCVMILPTLVHLSATIARYPYLGTTLSLGRGKPSLEGQEQLVSLLLEDHGSLIDDLATGMAADETVHFRIDGTMPLSQLRQMMENVYHWTDKIDYTQNDAMARVWYVSEEKLEPRLGERFEEPIEPYEQPLAPGRDAVFAMIEID